MPAFLVRPEDVQDQRLVLRAAEVSHLVQVRRHRVGQEIEVIDGRGLSYHVCIAAIERDMVFCQILERREGSGESAVQFSLAPALLKGQRFDFVVEKATEIGVSRIVPLLSERGVVKPGSGNKLERWQRLAGAAAKQCGRSHLPAIELPAPFGEVIKTFREENDQVLMATPGLPGRSVRQVLKDGNCRRLGLLIGPEGGFATREQELAKEAGVELFSWAGRILRADTASIVLGALVLHESEQNLRTEE